MKRLSARNRNNCKYSKLCGGCSYTGITYVEQVARKQQYINDLLSRQCKVGPIVICNEPFYYRNKVHSGYKKLKNGSVVCGPYLRGSHRIIDCEECLLENKTAGSIIRDCARIAEQIHVNVYNEVSGVGTLRRVLVRVAEKTGEVMVVIVIGNKYFAEKKIFIQKLRALHPEITTILVNINHRHDSMILGDTTRIEFGPGYITDELLGLKFRISPSSFYQVNRAQTEKLYTTAIMLANIEGNERVLDCYSGIGTITLSFAKLAGYVVGVENNPEAVRDAIKNQRNNGLKNAEFICEDATLYMQRSAAQGIKYDVVVLDPTRLGTTTDFIKACAAVAPQKIVYVSCGPDTLARDLKLFAKYGYKAEKAIPVDMFPWTEHVECVVLITRSM